MASAIGNPTLDMWLTFMTASHAWGENRLEEAFLGWREAAMAAAHCGSVIWEFRALAATASVAGMLRRSDAEQICAEVLRRLHEARSWGDVWYILEITFVLWANAGRTGNAGVLLGFLEAQNLHHTLIAEARAASALAVRASPGISATIADGADLDRDQVVAYALAHLTPASA